MSNALAIAAVTSTLRFLLEKGIHAASGLTSTGITVRPPDKARGNKKGKQLNMFLYQTQPDAALRNNDIPRQVRPGETAYPPLALNLYYLITVWGEDGDYEDTVAHHILGLAMSILHDHPLLGAPEIRSALRDNDLADQIERVRVTMQPMTLEEMSKLWSAFQTHYRLSVAYEVRVVLIESKRPVRTPLPVLTRGKDDSGIIFQPNLLLPYPVIGKVLPPNKQDAAQLDDLLTITGNYLDGSQRVIVMNRPWDTPQELSVEPGGTATEIKVKLPGLPDKWPSGFYTLSILIKKADQPDRTTNELPFALAPKIDNITPNPANINVDGSVNLTLVCNPQVRLEQRASLLLGDREILAESRTNQTDPLIFKVKGAVPGDYFIRVRVDGVDSLLVDRSVTPPVFKLQKVTLK